MITTITHSQISATTAGKLGKGATAENVSNILNTYASSTLELMKNHLPASKDDQTLVETPLVGFKVLHKTSGVVKDPEGKDIKIGTNYTIKTAIPKAFTRGINEDVIKGLGKVGEAILNMLSGTGKKAS